MRTRRTFLKQAVGAAGSYLLRNVSTDVLTLKAPHQPLPLGALALSDFAEFKNELYSGANPFSGVTDLTGATSRHYVRNENRLTEPEKHTTTGTTRDEQKGATVWVAFDWLWQDKADLALKGWCLVEQLQMSGSPIQALSVTKTLRWQMTTRDGSSGVKQYDLGAIRFGVPLYGLVGVHLDDKPAGWIAFAVSHDDFPAPGSCVFREGIQTWQGAIGHHTMGIYAERASSGKYVGYWSRFGRAVSADEAIIQARLVA